MTLMWALLYIVLSEALGKNKGCLAEHIDEE